jgi:hypothetical protein
LDRTFGGTTLVVHVEGATRPGSPTEPEYIKADVYFPDHMVREEPYTSRVVSDIVQQFIRNIGIPTIKRFNRCVKLLWNLPSYSGTIPEPYPLQPTSPIASPPGSSVFCFYGNLKQNQAIVIDSDSDDDKPHFMTENTALRTQLMQVHQSIKRTEDMWANYNRHEQPLPISAIPVAHHLNHLQRHLPTFKFAPFKFLTTPKEPCLLTQVLSLQRHRSEFLHGTQFHCQPVAQGADCLSLPKGPPLKTSIQRSLTQMA